MELSNECSVRARTLKPGKLGFLSLLCSSKALPLTLAERQGEKGETKRERRD